MSVELHQAFALIVEGETGQPARAAMEAIHRCALEMARSVGRRPADHDDCAQEVTFKLWKRLSMGDCPVRSLSAPACTAYVRRMVENWLIDRHRREAAQRRSRERIRDDGAPRAENAEERAVSREDDAQQRKQVARMRALLERVARYAIERRQPRHRAHLEQGWEEIAAMVFEGTPLRRLIAEREGELAGDAYVRARNVAYKRHQRTREALESALDALAMHGEMSGETTSQMNGETTGQMSAEEVELTRLAIAALARCQRSDADGVDEETS